MAAVLGLTTALAPEPDEPQCWRAIQVLAEFEVQDRRGVGQRIPSLADEPEVVGDPISVDGEPAGLSVGPLRVKVEKCRRYDQIPTIGGLMAPQPAVAHRFVWITNARSDLTLYSEVDLRGMTID